LLRKDNLAKLLRRNKEKEEEEKILIDELKKIEVKVKKDGGVAKVYKSNHKQADPDSKGV